MAIKVATSVIQIGSSRGGYCKERVMQGGSGWNSIITQASIKKELLVFIIATNPITVVTDICLLL